MTLKLTLLFAANIKVFSWRILHKQSGSDLKFIFKLLFETGHSCATQSSLALGSQVRLRDVTFFCTCGQVKLQTSR